MPYRLTYQLHEKGVDASYCETEGVGGTDELFLASILRDEQGNSSTEFVSIGPGGEPIDPRLLCIDVAAPLLLNLSREPGVPQVFRDWAKKAFEEFRQIILANRRHKGN